jgi:hypothetical protein
MTYLNLMRIGRQLATPAGFEPATFSLEGSLYFKRLNTLAAKPGILAPK